MKTQDMIDSLLTLGVQRGAVTCQELSDAFPAEIFSLEEVERFLRLLEEQGVKVVDSEKKLRSRKNHHTV